MNTEEIADQLPRIRAYAVRLTRSHADADDLVQDVVERALTLWPAYQANLRNLGGWLRLLTYQEFCRRYRKTQRRAEISLDDFVDSTGVCTGDARRDVALLEARDEVSKLLAQLPVAQRQAVERIYLHGETDVEVAAELDCPRETVRTRVHRGVKRMRERC